MKQNKPYIIGLTGSAGSGKSTCAAVFENLGIPVVDADKIAYKVCEPGEAGLIKIEEVFGKDYINEDGTYNRERMREHVSKDRGELDKLNSILHPIIKDEREKAFDKLSDSKIVVYDCPLLFEAGEEEIVDEVLLVTVSDELRIERVVRRDNLNPEQAAELIALQEDEAEKIKRADSIIVNDATLEELEATIREYLKDVNEKIKKP